MPAPTKPPKAPPETATPATSAAASPSPVDAGSMAEMYAHGVVNGEEVDFNVNAGTFPAFDKSDVSGRVFPFFFTHHPKAWEWVRTKGTPAGEFLPRLKQFALMPGANRVRGGYRGRNRPTEIQTNLALAWLAGAGITVINPAQGPGGRSFLRKMQVLVMPTKKVVYAHFTVWDIIVLRDSVTRWEFDVVGYRAWLRTLMQHRVIAPPDASVLIDEIGLMQHRLDRYAKFPADNELIKRKTKKATETLDLLAAKYRTLYGVDPLDTDALDEMRHRAVRGEPAELPDQAAEEPIA